jgi:hypothetical protein
MSTPGSIESPNALSEQQILFRMILWGVGVSLFFSMITFLLGVCFRGMMQYTWKYLIRLTLIQFLILLGIYAGILITISFRNLG